MKYRSIKYLIKEGFKNIWSNWVMSLSSTIVLMCCLFLTGAVVIFSLNINRALKAVESNNIVVVHLDLDVSEDRALEIGKQIKELPNIESCVFRSKEKEMQKYQDLIPKLGNLLGQDNPLPHAFHVSMQDLSKYAQTEQSIKAISGVDTLSNHRELAQKLTDLNNIISTVEIFIIVIFGLVSLFIISNTISITMYSRRQQIIIMKSVGATNSFVRVPFVVEGILIGILSALGAIAFLKMVSDLLSATLKELMPFLSSFQGIDSQVCLAFIGVGAMCGLLGGIISIGRYLRKDGGEILG